MTTPLNLSGRTAVVTGGESGLGRAIAMALAGHGAIVVVGDLVPRGENEEPFGKLGIVQMKADMRLESDVHALIDHAGAMDGGVDILANVAGIEIPKEITQVTEEDWDVCLDTNVKAAFFATKHAIPRMRQRGGGAIVNMSSNAGLLPRVSDPVYTITKAALITLTKTIALAHARDRIRVNAICPGPVAHTGMLESSLDAAPDRDEAIRQLIEASPLACAYDRLQTPEEIAACVLYLVSDAAAMVTGTVIAIDGGKSLGVPPT